MVKAFMESLKWTAEEISLIARETADQHLSEKWHTFRKGLLSGSILHSCEIQGRKLYTGKEITPSVTATIMGENRFKGNNATRYGILNESNAIDAYVKHVGPQHRNMKLIKVGMILSPDMGYLGGSIDRYRVCDCCPSRVIEIKCPSSLEACTYKEFCKMPYLKEDGQNLKLSENHPYFAQLQSYMKLTGTKISDFIIWSPLSMIIVHVNFNSDYWSILEKNISKFYRICIAPILLSIAAPKSTTDNFLSSAVRNVPAVKDNICSSCKKFLPDEEHCKPDNSDASVQCECTCGCNKWFHWECCNYSIQTKSTDRSMVL